MRLVVFVLVWMAIVVLMNTFVFAGNRTMTQLIISNIAILAAVWLAVRAFTPRTR